ncbi:helix-turn-helix domain-containing protein [Pseudonocardia sp. CA-107938]|uniref:helix-turn-helix domain-containing protein n=1 Tax=Pseudonocardia sp. CA-107938 TaxID=3240021 RepID=UPI003D8B4340
MAKDRTPQRVRGSTRIGAVGGYTLKVIRESTGRTQGALAELLGIDLATIQGWESGRRPLHSLRSVDLSGIRAALVDIGAEPYAFDVLRDAIDADVMLTSIISERDFDIDRSPHPLSLCVSQRDFVNLVTWPFSGVIPIRLRDVAQQSRATRRGPTPDRPVLARAEQESFFDNLLSTVQRVHTTTTRREDDSIRLLHRQAIYLLGFDPRPSTQDWLADHRRACMKRSTGDADLTSWTLTRSAAVALAKNGNMEPLEHFVSRGLVTDAKEQANLRYWAYWIGEMRTLQRNDGFMVATADDHAWSGDALFEHLLGRLWADIDHLPLNAHTLSSLMLARPHIISRRPDLSERANTQLVALLDTATMPPSARRELTNVLYGIRLAAR